MLSVFGQFKLLAIGPGSLRISNKLPFSEDTISIDHSQVRTDRLSHATSLPKHVALLKCLPHHHVIVGPYTFCRAFAEVGADPHRRHGRKMWLVIISLMVYVTDLNACPV